LANCITTGVAAARMGLRSMAPILGVLALSVETRIAEIVDENEDDARGAWQRNDIGTSL
jgi:hypothetical protein